MIVWNCSNYITNCVMFCCSCPRFNSTHGNICSFLKGHPFSLNAQKQQVILKVWTFGCSVWGMKARSDFFFYYCFYQKVLILVPKNLMFQCCVLAKTKTPKWKKQIFDNHLLHKWNRPYTSSSQWAKWIP